MLNYSPKFNKEFRVQVFRDHSFELVGRTLGAYLEYAGLGIEFFTVDMTTACHLLNWILQQIWHCSGSIRPIMKQEQHHRSSMNVYDN
jgi:hypothetical protein